jgi:carbon monoxide dehydrogenase subunit G
MDADREVAPPRTFGITFMLHFQGDKDVPAPPVEVTERLGDARFLTQCVPGLESVRQAEQNCAVCRVRPGLSFVRGTLDITLSILAVVPGVCVRYRVHGKGIGSSNTVEGRIDVSPREGGSRIHWIADVTELGGLLRAVPQGLIQGAAQKVIDDIWANVAAQLTAG